MALRTVIMPDGHIISNVPEDVTYDEVVAKYNKKKAAEEEIPKAFEAPAEEPELAESAPEPSFGQDYARTITRTGASIANIPMELIKAGREAVGLDTEVAELYQRRVTEAIAEDVSGGISEVPVEQIITSEGKVKTPETVGGMVFSAAPYLVGGAATMSTKLVKALPRLVQGIASGVAVDQILYDGEDNLANVLDDAGLAEAEGIAKDLIDFFAVEKDDGTLERRAKLIAEGVVLGGAFEVILGGTGAAIKAAKAKFGKNITDLNTDEKSELIVDYLKEARETVAYRATPQPVDYSETAEGVAQIAQQNSSGIRRFMQQMFSSRGYFTPKAYNAFNDAQYAQRQVVAQAENISNRLQQTIRSIGDEVDSSELVERINKALVGEELEVPLPANIAKEVEQARELIDEMSGRIINSSIPNDEFREVIAENAGSYIRRSYRLFEDTGYKPSANVRSNAREYIANAILNKKEDISIDRAYQEADGAISRILGEGEGEKKVFEYFQGLRRVNTEILQGRKDIPEPIRALMGEITEPSENIVLTVSKMARLVETNKFFEAVNNLGAENYIFDSSIIRNGVEYNEIITGTNSVLDGKYTTKEMLTALKEKESMLIEGDGGAIGNLYRNFLTLKGGSQLVKTVYSHVTHLRNVLGGAQFGVANGTNPFGKEGMRTLSVLKNRISQGGDEALDELYQKYLRLGIINTNVRVNEFRELLDTGFKSKAGTFAQKISEKLKGYGLSAEAQKLPEEVYMAVDDFYKVTNFEYELDVLKKAFPDESVEVLEARAADIVQNTFPNYDRVPKGVKAVRYLPIGNFVSFPTEIWRTSAHILTQGLKEIKSGNNTLRKRGLQRLGGYAATMYGWGAIAEGSAQLAGLTPDEAEAAQYLSETPWSRAPRNFVRIDGKLYANDTQFINSYSAVSTPFLDAYKAIQDGSIREDELDQILGDAIFEATEAFLAPYIEESIFTKAILDIGIAKASSDGRTPEGKEIFTPGLDNVEKSIKAFEHLALAFEPGSIKSLRDLAGSALEVPNRNTGQPKDLRAELFTNLTGIRFTELRPEDALMYSVKDYNYKSQNIVRPQAKYGMKASEVETRYDQRQRQLYEYQQDLYAKYAAAEQLMGRGAASRVLLDSGLSEKQVEFLIANRFFPEEPSETLMLDMYEKLPEEEKLKNGDAIAAMWRRYAQYSRTKLIRPVEEPKVERERRAKGGEVFVPQAPTEPDERIDKVTGLPYNIQAGSAFIDEEDPEKRMAFMQGGTVEDEENGFFDRLSEAFVKKVFGDGSVKAEIESGRGKQFAEEGDLGVVGQGVNDALENLKYVTKPVQALTESTAGPLLDTGSEYVVEEGKEYLSDLERNRKLLDAGKITTTERDIRAAGETVDLAMAPINDLVDETLQYVPYFEEAAQYISETEAVQDLAQLAAQNPRATEDIIAVTQLLGVIPAVKVFERGINRIASAVDTNIPGYYGPGATTLKKVAVAGKAFGRRVPGAVVEALGPGYSAVRRVTGLSPAKISTAVKALAKKSKHKAGDALAEILTGRYIGLQSREKTGLIHDRNPLVMVHEYGYDDAFNDASFKRNVFASIEEGGNVAKAVPEQVQEDAIEHLFKAWEVKKPDETFIVYKRPDGPQNLGDEIFSSSYEQGAKNLKSLLAPATGRRGGAQKKMLTFYNQQRKKNGQGPVDSIDSMPPEVLKAYLKKEKVNFVEGTDDFIYIKESYVSGAKEIGGVNVFSAVNTRTGDVFSMVSDKHDIFKDIDPVRGRSLLTVQPMISKNFKTGLIGGFKRRDFVAEAQEAKNLFQEVYNLAVQRGGKKAGEAFEEKYFKGMNKELDKIINKDPTKYEGALNDVVPATIKILEYIKDNPEIIVQDYKDVARRVTTSSAAVPLFVGDQED